mmetsp:Transcript_107166/g.298493  ORF Transcript_107166/g.298493 Transcript_107166/m.298493 type:complete len:216 (+) Transcript_107166:616-1263(+)
MVKEFQPNKRAVHMLSNIKVLATLDHKEAAVPFHRWNAAARLCIVSLRNAQLSEAACDSGRAAADVRELGLQTAQHWEVTCCGRITDACVTVLGLWAGHQWESTFKSRSAVTHVRIVRLQTAELCEVASHCESTACGTPSQERGIANWQTTTFCQCTTRSTPSPELWNTTSEKSTVAPAQQAAGGGKGVQSHRHRRGRCHAAQTRCIARLPSGCA